MINSKNNILLLVGFIVGGVFLYLALKEIQFKVLIDTIIHNVNYWYALPFTVLCFGFFWFKAMRWKYLLHPVIITETKKLFPMIMIGYAGNIIFPAQIGEFIRVYLSSQQMHIKVMPVLSTLFLERIFDIFTLLLLLVTVIMFNSKNYPALVGISYIMAGIILFGLIIIIAFLFFTNSLLILFRLVTRFLPIPMQEKILKQVKRVADGMQSIKQPRLLFGVFLSSLAMWTISIFSMYLALLAVDQLALPFSASVMVLVISVAGLALPTSPGFVGTIQYSFVLGLSAYGIGRDQAVAASVLYHALITIPPLLLGLYYFVRSGYKARQLQEEVVHYKE